MGMVSKPTTSNGKFVTPTSPRCCKPTINESTINNVKFRGVSPQVRSNQRWDAMLLESTKLTLPLATDETSFTLDWTRLLLKRFQEWKMAVKKVELEDANVKKMEDGSESNGKVLTPTSSTSS
ncbi:hypothetical protein Q3G72_029536 [Acer saccharum]|nr:hypothetical protein Q3G72_029536 [Acer saccharum]